MRGFFRFLSKDDSKSKNIAKERLKMVITHDRANVSPKYLDMMRNDILKVMSHYIDIEEDGVDIKLTRLTNDDDTYTSTLIANIPIKKVKNIGRNKS
ncbi:MAG: cell division topological specificity factor MinE [Clostridiales bacterium]|nr:cell division topological specificity factor MinE [Clostridiales bacterium]